jgi:hypothetical protein
VVDEVYQPMPNDIYISTVVDHDVVFIGGNTYIWVVGPDGARHRQFYTHGDHREDVFRRRDELHNCTEPSDARRRADSRGCSKQACGQASPEGSEEVVASLSTLEGGRTSN